MHSERQLASSAPPEKPAAEAARLTVERAEAAWQRQIEGENAAASPSSSTTLRIVLLGAAIAAIVLLLLQRIAQIG